MHAKNVKFLGGFFCNSFVEGKTKEAFYNSKSVFAYVISQKQENQQEKK